MVVAKLVKAGVAVPNPDYDPSAPRDLPCAVQVLVIHPERIISFDETRVKLDMTKNTSKAKWLRTMIDKTVPRASQRDALAQKGGLAGTGVGGSTASNQALLSLFILAASSSSSSWCVPLPACGFADEHGKMREGWFYVNKKGGMEFDLGVRYFKVVVLPGFCNTSASTPLVVFCDGHGSHLTVDLVKFCRDNHVVVLLRVPHTSHLTQGENLRNFQAFKTEVAMTKAERLAKNVSMNVYKLRSCDFMSVVAPAWNAAFTPKIAPQAGATQAFTPSPAKCLSTWLRVRLPRALGANNTAQAMTLTIAACRSLQSTRARWAATAMASKTKRTRRRRSLPNCGSFRPIFIDLALN
eukprot:893248-Pleurochrysis_carterae.AAC.1